MDGFIIRSKENELFHSRDTIEDTIEYASRMGGSIEYRGSEILSPIDVKRNSMFISGMREIKEASTKAVISLPLLGGMGLAVSADNLIHMSEIEGVSGIIKGNSEKVKILIKKIQDYDFSEDIEKDVKVRRARKERQEGKITDKELVELQRENSVIPDGSPLLESENLEVEKSFLAKVIKVKKSITDDDKDRNKERKKDK